MVRLWPIFPSSEDERNKQMILSLDSNVEVLYLFGREFLLTLRGGSEKTPSQYFI
jgi:hypothetical protein